MKKSVFVTGVSRSGTSMTSGLFAKHGVWFGKCMEAREINKKGFYESIYFKEQVEKDCWENFNAGWENWLSDNGASEPWGIKAGIEHFHLFEKYNPVIVCCYRDLDDLLSSRKNAGFHLNESAIKTTWDRMEKLPNAYKVYPDQFVQGDFSGIIEPLKELGIEFDMNIATDWVSPELWNNNS